MKDSPSDVIARLKEYYGIHKDKDLREFLKIESQSTMSTWKSRDKPTADLYRLCINLSKRDGLNLFWVLTGEGESAVSDSRGAYELSKEKLTNRQRLIVENLIEELERLNQSANNKLC